MRFAAAPEYEVFPTLDEAAEAVPGGGARRRSETRELIDEFDPEVVVADILTVAAALGRADGRAAVGHAHPPCAAAVRAGLAAVLDRRAAAAHADRAGAVASDGPARCAAASSRDARSSTSARARVGPAAARPRARRHLARAGARRARSPSSSTRAPIAEPWLRVTGPLMWEQPFDDVELPPGDEPLVLVAPVDRPGPRAADAARRARGARATSRCGCSPRRTGARRPSRSPCRRTRGSWTGSPTPAPCRSATRS